MSSPGSSALAGRRVAVIGGSAGIGLAIAGRAAASGARVVLAGRDAARAEAAASRVGGEARTLDASNEAAVAGFFAALGPIDHLVVTAAATRGGMLRGGDTAAARATFEGKFWPQYLCAKHAAVTGSILLTGGAFSRRATPGVSAIAAVNGAVEALGRALAVELAPVRVNVLAPGLIGGTEAYAGMPEEARAAMLAATAKRLPVGLVGDADSVAGPAVALLESPYATGVVLDIDGGWLLS